MSTRADFLAEVRKTVGTPFHHQGRVPGVGLDCPGPMIHAAWALGLAPRTENITGYSLQPDGVSLQSFCEQYMDRIDFSEAEPGDVVLCRFREGHPQHLGVLSDANPERRYWIHANGRGARKEVMETRLDLSTRYMSLVAAYRVRGLE